MATRTEINKLALIERLIQLEDPALLAQIEALLNPIPDWHKQVLAERLAEYEANPETSRPWSEVKVQLQNNLAKKRQQQDPGNPS